MALKSLNKAIKSLEKLNYTDLKRAKQFVCNRIAEDEVGNEVSKCEDSVDSCPHCRAECIVKWGASKQGKQRFKCKDCLKTFTALTNTPLNRMRKPNLIMDYGRLMDLALPLRDCAYSLGINLKTAFLWRHKLLMNPEICKPVELGSIVEVDEAFIRPSKKGQRNLGALARKRGSGVRKKIPILLALDRQGVATHFVMPNNSKHEIIKNLSPILSPGSTLCSDGNASYSALIKLINHPMEHKVLIAAPGKKAKIDGIYSIQRLNNYIMNWRSFMKPFRGVATHYLDRYLSWFRYRTTGFQGIEWIKEGLTRPLHAPIH